MGKYYKHFKGNIYKLIGIAKDSETLENMVVYQAMYGDHQMWVRPEKMFFGKVERDEYHGQVFQQVLSYLEQCQGHRITIYGFDDNILKEVG